MKLATSLMTAAAALSIAGMANAQFVAQKQFKRAENVNSAGAASEAAQARAGVAATGEATDTSFEAVQYPALRVDATVRDRDGAKIGYITQVIGKDGGKEAYAVVRTPDGRIKAPASQLFAMGGDFYVDRSAGDFLASAEPAA